MRTYCFLSDLDEVLGKCVARDEKHARVKFEAFYGEAFHPCATVMLWADWQAQEELVREQMGNAAWQKRLNREERKNKSPLV